MKTRNLLNVFLALTVALSPLGASASERFIFRQTLPVNYVPGTGNPQNPGGPALPEIPADAEIVTVLFTGPVGQAFSKAIPATKAEVAEWRKVSGTIQSGLELDPWTGVISGTAKGTVTSKDAVFLGYNTAGEITARANATFKFFDPVGTPSSFTVSGYAGKYLFSNIPTTADVDRWEASAALPKGLAVNGLALDGTPEAPVETSASFLGYDFLGNRVAVATAAITVKSGPVMEEIGNQLRHPETPFSVTPVLTFKVGTPTYRLDAIDGLPDGLEFNAQTGRLEGRIATFGTTLRFRIEAIDNDGSSVTSNEFSLSTFEQDIDISAMQDLTATFGMPYSLRLSADGSTAPASWAVVSGQLPAGITLDRTTGILSGTPLEEGLKEDIVISASAANNVFTQSRPFSFTVFPENVAVAFTPIRTRTGVPFTSEAPEFLSGKVEPYSFRANPLSVPDPQLTVNYAQATVYGSLAAPGNYNVAFDLHNGDGRVNTFIQPITAYAPLSLSYPATANAVRRKAATIKPSVATAGIVGSPRYEIASGTLPAGLSINGKTGEINGIPTATTTASGITVRLTDETGASQTSNVFTVNVADRPDVTVTVKNLNVERYVEAETVAATAANAHDGVRYELVAGTLPEGLRLDPDGKIRGTTLAPLSTFTGLQVMATDGEGYQATSEPFSVTLVAPSSLEVLVGTPTTVEWTAGKPFTFDLPKPSNSFGSLSYSVSALPAGVTRNGGKITGSVAGPGSYVMTVAVSDETSRSLDIPFTLVAKPQMTATFPSTHTAARMSAFKAEPSITNGIAPVTVTMTGTLPAGLDFSDGVISGTPTSTGETKSVTLRVTDATGTAVNLPTTITVGERNPLELSYDFSALAYRGTAISGGFVPTLKNRVGTVSYSVDGDLPPGVSFSPSTGRFSGTPLADGRFPGITVTAVDSEGDSFKAVAGPYEMKVAYPGNVGIAEETNITVRKATLFSERLVPSYVTAPLTFSHALDGDLPYNLAIDASTGEMTGYFDNTGRYLAQVRITDDFARSAVTKVAFTVVDAMTVAPPALKSFNQFSKVSVKPVVANAIGATTYSLTGVLPDGLGFDAATGTISGTPTVKQTKTGLRITATDSKGTLATSAAFSLAVTDRVPMTMATSASYTVIANQNFKLTLKPENAIGEVAFAHTAGAFPAGVTFDAATGTFSGIATVIGTFSGITVTATDQAGGSVTKSFSFNAVTNGQAIGLTTTAFTTKVGFRIETAAPTVTNAVGDISFRGDGTLAKWGLSINPATGMITGTATELMNVNFNIVVTDSSNRVTSKPVNIRVIPPTVISAPEQVNLVVNSGMSTLTLAATNTVGTTTWSIEGRLPEGITFTPAYRRFTGTPKEMGTFDIVVKTVDTTGEVASRDMTFKVANNGRPPEISFNITALPGYMNGTAYTVNMNTYNGKTGDTVTSVPGYNLPPRTTISQNASGTWQLLKAAGTDADSGVYPLHLRITDSLGLHSEPGLKWFGIRPNSFYTIADQTLTTYKGVIVNTPAPVSSGKKMGTPKFAFTRDVTGGTLTIDPDTGSLGGYVGANFVNSSYNYNTVTVTETHPEAGDIRSFTYKLDITANDLPSYLAMEGRPITGQSIANAAATGTGTTYSIANGAPAGIGINSSTGALTGTPAAGSAGLYTVNVRVSNAAGSTTVPIPVEVFGPTSAGYKYWKFDITAISYKGYATVQEIDYTLADGRSVNGVISTKTPTATAAGYDGNTGTGYSGQNYLTSTVMFHQPMDIRGATIWQQTVFGSGLGRFQSYIESFTISASNDNTNWTVIKSSSLGANTNVQFSW